MDDLFKDCLEEETSVAEENQVAANTNELAEENAEAACQAEEADATVELLVLPKNPEDEENDSISLTIILPIEKVNVDNLNAIIAAKGQLIKEALQTDCLDVKVNEEEGKVLLPWFSTAPDADHSGVYLNFLSRLCEFSKERKRINSTAKEVANKKYAFRCFLLRLGYVGDEFKKDRKILLANLEGSSAFKSGARKEKEVKDDVLSE